MKKIRKRLLAAAAAFVFASGVVSAAGAAYISASVTTRNSAPIAENISLTTYRDVSAAGRFKAIDPDGDAVIFEVTSEPEKGVLFLGDGGTFTYKPDSGKSGHDSFKYIAKDESGASSAEAKVTVSIRRQSTAVFYADMEDSAACYAALRLAEEKLFVGERLGTEYFFRPDECVSRGEFLAMALQIAGVEPLNGVSSTSFSDDADTEKWVKPYISAALMSGYISGYKTEDGQTVFSADRDITSEEAAVMLNNVLGISDVVSAGAFDEESSVSVWARSAASNLMECGIVSEVSSSPLTREEAAVMLSNALDIIEEREQERKFVLFR